jgi:hypothetical protein
MWRQVQACVCETCGRRPLPLVKRAESQLWPPQRDTPWKPGQACACECIVHRHDAEEIKSSAGVVMHDTQVG